MDEAQVRAVLGRALPRRAAVLLDHTRVQPTGGYPWVVPQAGATVEGVLLDDLDAAALEAIDAYEDEGYLYHRRDAVALVAGRHEACQVYVGAAITRAHGRG